MSYKYSVKNPASERPLVFSNDSFPVLSKPETVSLKPATVWDSSVPLSEKLKEVIVTEVNLILQSPVFPNMRVRVFDNPNLQVEMDSNHPTLKLVERLEDLRYARFERDRLKAIELKARRKIEGIEDDDDVDSVGDSGPFDDSISEIYSEQSIPDNMSNQSDEVE